MPKYGSVSVLMSSGILACSGHCRDISPCTTSRWKGSESRVESVLSSLCLLKWSPIRAQKTVALLG